MWKRVIRLVGEQMKSGDGTLRLIVVMGAGVLTVIALGIVGVVGVIAAKYAGLI